jgi:uncharacterized protein with HEPN domain
MPSNDEIRLRHMLDAVQEAIQLAQGRNRQDLDNDRLLNLGLVRLLEIIGEAARGVSAAFREAHADIPWKSISGMRDRLIHGYYDVNLDIVWRTIQEDLPSLVVQLKRNINEI